MEINGKYERIKIYAKTIEDEAIKQITEIANSPLGENANIRIMPDCHSGAGCVIGTTMKITDKICPNVVGVDIGCGVKIVKTNIKFDNCLEKLDNIIRDNIPNGRNVNDIIKHWDFTQLKCYNSLDKKTKELAQYSLGTLGGGNHFIECYKDGYLSGHSGSRNIGLKVAQYYQKLAINNIYNKKHKIFVEELKNIIPTERESFIKNNKINNINEALSYLENEDLYDYLYDISIIQQFAKDNRNEILNIIIKEMNCEIVQEIESIHNYIDIGNMILRKGAISAQKNEKLIITLNMRDGVLIGIGKGNEDWNYSAPHGAGRLYSRTKAKNIFNVNEYKNSMNGIYSSCICYNTLDEAPFAYKDYNEIMECIKPTVDIIERLIPIYNFKASE